MFVNTYDITLETEEGKEITVALRLSVGAQIQLKKKWNESTTQTLFGAADDIEKFVDVMDKALKWKGNENEIQSGSDLIELMAENGLLGMAEKQKIVTALGEASGMFSHAEKARIDARTEHMFDGILGSDKGSDKGSDDEEDSGKGKN